MTSGQEMNVEITKHDDTVVASPVGEIDLARSPSLRNRLAEILAEKPARLIIDLAQVPYMDSSGVATLVFRVFGLSRRAVPCRSFGSVSTPWSLPTRRSATRSFSD